MTRDDQRSVEPEDEDRNDEGPGRVGTTSPVVLAGLFILGLIAGRLIQPVTIWTDRTAPRVGWLPILLLFFGAAVLGAVAWSTWRTLQRGHGYLRPHQAVNRLVLAKACALVGALVAGGYIGYAISWIGDEAQLAGERLGHSALAALASVLMVAGSLTLERACRVGNGKRRP